MMMRVMARVARTRGCVLMRRGHGSSPSLRPHSLNCLHLHVSARDRDRRTGREEGAEEVHAHARVSPEPHLWGKKVRECGTRQEMREVMKHFQEIGGEPNAIMWNTLLNKSSSREEARSALEEMRAAGVEPDTISWGIVLKLCSSSDEMREVMSEMKQSGCEANIDLWNILLMSYSSLDKAKSVLDEMQEAGVQPSVISWGIVVNLCSSSDDIRKLMSEMKLKGCEPNAVIWNTLLKSHSSAYEVREVMAEMVVEGIEPDTHSWCTLMSRYPNVYDMLAVVDEMKAASVPIGAQAWTNIMHSLKGRNGTNSVQEAINSILSHDSRDIFAWNRLLVASLSQEDKLTVMKQLAAVGNDKNSFSLNVFLKKGASRISSNISTHSDGEGEGDINSNAAESNCLLVKKIFDDMINSGIKPDLPSWNVVLNAYAVNKSSPEVVRDLMDEMREGGLTPDLYSWSALIKCYVHPPQRKRVMEEMKDAGLIVDVDIWSLLLESYRRPKGVRWAWDDMLASGITPNSSCYSILFNILLRAKCSQEVIRMYNEELKEKPYLINNYVANAIIRALADDGDEAEISDFWEAYSQNLSPTDLKMLEILSLRPYNIECFGWYTVRALLQRDKAVLCKRQGKK